VNEPTISEPGSEKRKRGRPRSWVRTFADELRRSNLIPEGCGSERSRMNVAYRAAANGPAMRLLSADERAVLLGASDDELRRGTKTFPRGWDSLAVEVGRLLSSLGADDETERGYLLVAVNARRDGASWRTIRSHFRALRLGKRAGNAVSLLQELARTIDSYCSRFPATTDTMVAGAVRSLIEVVAEQIAGETGSLG
jgi:hypothetical protein